MEENPKLQICGDVIVTQLNQCHSCGFPIAVPCRIASCCHLLCKKCVDSILICPFCKKPVSGYEVVNSTICVVCTYPDCFRSYLSQYSLTEHIKLRHSPTGNPYQGKGIMQ